MKRAYYWIDEMFGIPERVEDWLILIGVAIFIPSFCIWLLAHCDITLLNLLG